MYYYSQHIILSEVHNNKMLLAGMHAQLNFEDLSGYFAFTAKSKRYSNTPDNFTTTQQFYKTTIFTTSPVILTLLRTIKVSEPLYFKIPGS